MISTCKCTHKAQDTLHGKGKRVFTETAKAFKCTVCSALKSKK